MEDNTQRAELLSELLSNGTMDRSGTMHRMRETGIALDYPYYRVALIPDLDLLAEKKIPLQTVEQLANDAIYNGHAYAVEHRGMLLLILGTKQGGDTGPHPIEDTMRHLIGVLRGSYGVEISICLGCEVYSPRDLPASYRTAMDLYDSALTNGAEIPAVSVSRPTLSGQNNMIYLSELHLMLGYLINGEFQAAAQILARVFDSYVQENKFYHSVMSERLEFFVSTFIQAAEAAISDNSEAIQTYLVLKSQLDNLQYPLPKERIHEIYRRIAAVAERAAEARQQSIIGPAMETRAYIDEHYTDPMLDNTMLSDALGYSVSYLTRLFKTAFDQTILSYITTRRISAAEMLLRETNMTVEDIAVRVGYNSASTFTRAFQKTHAASPNLYRKSAGKK